MYYVLSNEELDSKHLTLILQVIVHTPDILPCNFLPFGSRKLQGQT